MVTPKSLNKPVLLSDVDGTLSKGFYILKFPEFLAKRGLFDKRELENLHKIINKYKKGLINYETAGIEIVLTYGRGARGQKLDDYINLGFDYIKQNPHELFSFTVDLIEMFKDNGYTIIIASGSPLEIIGPFGISIGADVSYGTKYVLDSQEIFTGEVQLNLIEHEKKKLAETFSIEHNSDIPRSIGFGDSYTDVQFMEYFGNSVAILPEPILREIALKNNWLICDSEDSVLKEVRAFMNFN
ncbi:haloacid dehalogenase-like hydrolase [Candidatus Micrarchaeota archaeon]|nr:haloacid dehalogenase-like hydrolase [Candidatus Micrarchaeota archaeon]